MTQESHIEVSYSRRYAVPNRPPVMCAVVRGLDQEMASLLVSLRNFGTADQCQPQGQQIMVAAVAA